MRRVAFVMFCGGCELAFPLTAPPRSDADAMLPDSGPPSTIDASDRCAGYGSQPVLPNKVRIVLEPPLTWFEAEADCEADGAHLAVPRNAADMVRYVELVETAKPWAGVARDGTATNDQFRSITGIAFPQGPLWHPGEPSSTGPVVEIANDNDARLVDTSIAFRNRYICECDGIPPQPFDF
jgi:hypothetical protein